MLKIKILPLKSREFFIHFFSLFVIHVEVSCAQNWKGASTENIVSSEPKAIFVSVLGIFSCLSVQKLCFVDRRKF